jgi:hypothetical protein
LLQIKWLSFAIILEIISSFFFFHWNSNVIVDMCTGGASRISGRLPQIF